MQTGGCGSCVLPGSVSMLPLQTRTSDRRIDSEWEAVPCPPPPPSPLPPPLNPSRHQCTLQHTAIPLEMRHLLERSIQILCKQQVIFIDETNMR